MSSSIIRQGNGIVRAGESIANDCKCCGCPVRLQSAPLTMTNGLYAITADLTWENATDESVEIVCKTTPPFTPTLLERTFNGEVGNLQGPFSKDAIRVTVTRPKFQASFRRRFLDGLSVPNFPFGIASISWPSYRQESSCGADCPEFHMQSIGVSCQANNSLRASGQFTAKSPKPFEVSHEVIESSIEWKYVGPTTNTTILTITASVSASPAYTLDYPIYGFFSGTVDIQTLGTAPIVSATLPGAPPQNCTACHTGSWGVAGTATFTKTGLSPDFTPATATVPIGFSGNASFPASDATGQAALSW